MTLKNLASMAAAPFIAAGNYAQANPKKTAAAVLTAATAVALYACSNEVLAAVKPYADRVLEAAKPRLQSLVDAGWGKSFNITQEKMVSWGFLDAPVIKKTVEQVILPEVPTDLFTRLACAVSDKICPARGQQLTKVAKATIATVGVGAVALTAKVATRLAKLGLGLRGWGFQATKAS